MLHALAGETKKHGNRTGVAPSSARERISPERTLQSLYGNQALLRWTLQRKCACGGSGGQCECDKKKEEGVMQRKRAGASPHTGIPPVVHEVLRSPGQPLDRGTRAFMEPRFGYNFSQVRLHTGAKAAESARAVNALAYTVGHQIVFGNSQYAPETAKGRELLAHELTHTVQQRAHSSGEPRRLGEENDAAEREATKLSSEIVQGKVSTGSCEPEPSEGVVQRTPAKKVSCAASAPLKLPGGGAIDRPVDVITNAENRANTLLDQAISELDSTRKQILAGAAIAFPTISDALAFGLRLMGLDPDSERVWKQEGGVGNYTAALLLRRLRLVRANIGTGSFFFTCLGSSSDCSNAYASSSAGSFRIDLCPPFWNDPSPDDQAATIIHESFHNFADFIGDERHRGEGVAECYSRFALTVGGSNAGQLKALCPDPTQ